ncbi:hypothetical protein GCM10028895_50910 [Pontibacter rugosus]
MIEIRAIKPGPKPKKDDGSLDRRRRVTPEKKKNTHHLGLTNISPTISLIIA